MIAEIVGPDNPERDFVNIRCNYAHVRLPKYWIVNPQDETITVLRLAGSVYVEHEIFGREESNFCRA